MADHLKQIDAPRWMLDELCNCTIPVISMECMSIDSYKA
jgi:hypothetical protein